MNLYNALGHRSRPAGIPVCPPPHPAPPGPWFTTAAFGDTDRVREDEVLDDLAELTARLGSPLAAAQHLYAKTEAHRG